MRQIVYVNIEQERTIKNINEIESVLQKFSIVIDKQTDTKNSIFKFRIAINEISEIEYIGKSILKYLKIDSVRLKHVESQFSAVVYKEGNNILSKIFHTEDYYFNAID